MGMGSLVLAGLGVVATMFHYVTHDIILGVVCSLLLIGAFVFKKSQDNFVLYL